MNNITTMGIIASQPKAEMEMMDNIINNKNGMSIFPLLYL